jgi:hypothetical protein
MNVVMHGGGGGGGVEWSGVEWSGVEWRARKDDWFWSDKAKDQWIEREEVVLFEA